MSNSTIYNSFKKLPSCKCGFCPFDKKIKKIKDSLFQVGSIGRIKKTIRLKF